MTRAPRFGIGFLAEIVCGVALGFAAVRWASGSQTVQAMRGSNLLVSRITTFVNPFVSLTALSGLVAVALEVLLRRRPAVFGIGRWTWAATGAFVVVHFLRDFVRWRIPFAQARVNSPLDTFHEWLGSWLLGGTSGAITSTIVGVWIAYSLAGYHRDVAPDGREWLGRLFGIAVVLWSISLHVLWYFDV